MSLLKDKKYFRETCLLMLLLFLPFFISYPVESVNISDEIVRLHVIANSDSEYDQQLKLKVRDAVLEASKDIHRQEIADNLPLLNDTAKVVLESFGCDYPVSAQFGRYDFPLKKYGSVVFPAGEYSAIRITIGNGIGKNWWCVMYPPLCFTSETCANFDKESIDLLTRNGINTPNTPKFEIRFKILELFK